MYRKNKLDTFTAHMLCKGFYCLVLSLLNRFWSILLLYFLTCFNVLLLGVFLLVFNSFQMQFLISLHVICMPGKTEWWGFIIIPQFVKLQDSMIQSHYQLLFYSLFWILCINFKVELTPMPHTLLCPSRVLVSMTPWLLVRTGSLVGSLACSVFNLLLMQLCVYKLLF